MQAWLLIKDSNAIQSFCVGLPPQLLMLPCAFKIIPFMVKNPTAILSDANDIFDLASNNIVLVGP